MWSECAARLISGLLQDDMPTPGEWVLIHVGFAMSKISEEDAVDQMRTLGHWARPNRPCKRSRVTVWRMPTAKEYLEVA